MTVIAVKPASRGEGLVVRPQTLTTPGPDVAIAALARDLQTAFLCDARERDLEPLPICDGAVRLTMPGIIATLRLLV